MVVLLYMRENKFFERQPDNFNSFRFNNSEVLDLYEKAKSKDSSSSYQEIYSHKFEGSNLEYKIHYSQPFLSSGNSNGTFQFELFADNGERVADLIFSEREDGYDMVHRQVFSKDIGINGTSFLKKAEDYLGILMSGRAIDQMPLLIKNVKQKQVIEWALKNGFTFKDNSERLLYDELMQSGDFVLASDTVVSGGITRDEFILKKEVFEAWETENTRRRESGEPLISADKPAFKFNLIKDLTPA